MFNNLINNIVSLADSRMKRRSLQVMAEKKMAENKRESLKSLKSTMRTRRKMEMAKPYNLMIKRDKSMMIIKGNEFQETVRLYGTCL